MTSSTSRRRPDIPQIRIRRLRRHLDTAIDTVFAGMSAQSRYLRFHGPMPVLTASARRQLLEVDGRDRAAVVAEVRTRDSWEPVGIARLVATAPGQAELAVAVVDRMHGRGVGRRLLEALSGLAAELGYRGLHAEVLAGNVAMLHLLRAMFPGSRVVWAPGIASVSCPLDWASTPLTDADIYADLVG